MYAVWLGVLIEPLLKLFFVIVWKLKKGENEHYSRIMYKKLTKQTQRLIETATPINSWKSINIISIMNEIVDAYQLCVTTTTNNLKRNYFIITPATLKVYVCARPEEIPRETEGKRINDRKQQKQAKCAWAGFQWKICCNTLGARGDEFVRRNTSKRKTGLTCKHTVLRV